MTNSMLEKVAMAIAEDISPGREPDYVDRALARAAIQAMREPTEKMLLAVRYERDFWPEAPRGDELREETVAEIDDWQAMIDAALEEGVSTERSDG